MILPPERISRDDIRRLAKLQGAILPRSLISRLGNKYVQAFYRFLVRSKLDLLLLERTAKGEITAACVISLDVQTLERRLALHTPLLLYAAIRPLILLQALKHGGQPKIITGAELLLLFVASDARRCGYANKLVSQAETELIKRNIGSYQVRTFNNPKDPAFMFYISRGFECVGSFTARGYEFALMRRSTGLESPAEE